MGVAILFFVSTAGADSDRSVQEELLFDRPAALAGSERLLIDTVFNLLKKVRGVEADFQEVKIGKGGKRLESKGLFLYSRDQGLYRKMTQPFELEIRMTPREIIERNELGEVSSLPLKNIPQAKALADLFFSLFSGHTAQFEKQFDLFILGDINRWEMGLQGKSGSTGSRGIRRIVIQGEQDQFNRVDLQTEGGRVTTVYTRQTLFRDGESDDRPLPPFPVLTPVP